MADYERENAKMTSDPSLRDRMAAAEKAVNALGDELEKLNYRLEKVMREVGMGDEPRG